MMDMLIALGDFLVVIGDPFLSWMLYLPRDVALVLLAVMTGVIMTLIRRWTTNQDLLHRCKLDKMWLKARMADAKRRKDKETVKQIQMTNSQIALESFKAEGKPLLFSLLPIAILAMWAFARLGFVPPTPQDQVQMHLYFDVSEIDKLVHMLPNDKVTLHSDPIQQIGESRSLQGGLDGGMATWVIQGQPSDEPHVLRFRYQGEIVEVKYRADGQLYEPNVQMLNDHEKVLSAEFKLTEYRPAGVVPGVAWYPIVPVSKIPLLSMQDAMLPIALPAWLIGYLILVVPLALLLKPIMRVY